MNLILGFILKLITGAQHKDTPGKSEVIVKEETNMGEETYPWTVNYDELKAATAKCVSLGAMVSYKNVEREAKRCECSHVPQWCIITDAQKKGELHSTPCIKFDNGTITTESYDDIKKWYLNTGAQVIAITG